MPRNTNNSNNNNNNNVPAKDKEEKEDEEEEDFVGEDEAYFGLAEEEEQQDDGWDSAEEDAVYMDGELMTDKQLDDYMAENEDEKKSSQIPKEDVWKTVDARMRDPIDAVAKFSRVVLLQVHAVVSVRWVPEQM